MFCHDGSTIFYPTAPGRVYSVGVAALADCSGSDEDLSDSTTLVDLSGMVKRDSEIIHWGELPDSLAFQSKWPPVYVEVRGEIMGDVDMEATESDFFDALEQWADWCDRDSARRDSLDEIMGAVEVAA